MLFRSIQAPVSVFVLNAPEGKSSKKILAEGVFNSNIEKSFVLFADNADLAKTRLTQAGLRIQGLETIDQIAKENKTSPFRVVQVISAK